MKATRRLEGHTALVTGSGQGIGLAIARSLSHNGARVILNDVIPQSLHDAVQQLRAEGGDVAGVVGDVSSTADVDRMVHEGVEKLGAISLLVNNAGIGSPSVPVDEMPDELWEKMIAVHLTGAFKVTRAVVPIMKDRAGGRIVNMSSNAGQWGDIDYCHYSAAKAGILGLTKALAKELAKYRISVNAVAPGLIGTQILKVQPEDVLEAKIAQIPWGRLGTVGDVAELVCFLLADEADYITGQVICPNGGRTIVGI
jgi:NAD(P)-dependent dehydrogenase (short-subunit alcohol dehydrogenase family)